MSVLQTLYVYVCVCVCVCVGVGVCVCVCVCVLLCNMLHKTHKRKHCYYYYIKSTKGTSSTKIYHPALFFCFVFVPLGVKNQVFDAVH